ncbi:urease accessory protein UreH [Bacillus taeanensis]|uniref:Nickel/cobalt efflux system n=1 Tax=Bacillus taeanensis TaxID=273032 RepID=A0A366XTA6_9BACI|nr:urease accessory protein UreH [Bacillus taeanensis]RBW67393.1 urease accessory protein UreH [Bacillus taeanensis]
MEASLLSILVFGFLLGIKHAIEPDHVIAVSTIAGRSKNIWRSSLSGVFWGIGHTATLFIVGILLIVLKVQMSEGLALSLEFLVGIMLVYLGAASFRYKKPHQHEQRNEKTSYIRSAIIGFIHGLAGSAAMVLLTLSTVDHIGQAALYILIFGAGTVIGMLSFSTMFSIPFIFAAKKTFIHQRLIYTTGVISILFGMYYMYNLGVKEGLFSIWLS